MGVVGGVVWWVGVGQTVVSYPHTFHFASFPGPAQFSVACSKRRVGIFSHVSMAKMCKTTRLRFTYFQPTTPSTVGVYDSRLPLARYVW